jgi:hypothetical protein
MALADTADGVVVFVSRPRRLHHREAHRRQGSPGSVQFTDSVTAIPAESGALYLDVHDWNGTKRDIVEIACR